MDLLSTLANLVNAAAVTAGVIFAAVQIREFRKQRLRESMYTLVQTFQGAEFAKALVYKPIGLTAIFFARIISKHFKSVRHIEVAGQVSPAD